MPRTTDHLPSTSLAYALLQAARIDAAVLAGQSLADGLLGRVDAQARPAVQDLVYGSLRAYGRGDFFLQHLLNKPLAEAEVHALLLVALYRLETRPEAVHTVVDQAVLAAGEIANGRFKALVNGVLRSFLRQQPELTAVLAADAVAPAEQRALSSSKPPVPLSYMVSLPLMVTGSPEASAFSRHSPFAPVKTYTAPISNGSPLPVFRSYQSMAASL